MAILGRKITDLPEATELDDTSYLILTKPNSTNRISTSSIIRSLSGIRNGANLSSGLGFFKEKSGDTLTFNSLTANDGINISLSSNLIKLNIPNNALSINKLDSNLKTTIWNLTAAVQSLTVANTIVSTEYLGMISTFANNSAPSGWLICNGDVIPTTGTVQGVDAATKLQNLRTFLGNKFGMNGQLPDLRGLFVRGLDINKGIDPSRVLGTLQSDTAKINDFAATVKGVTTTRENLPVSNSTGNKIDFSPTAVKAKQIVTATTSQYSFKISPVDNLNPSANQPPETRPKNIALLYCIKY